MATEQPVQLLGNLVKLGDGHDAVEVATAFLLNAKFVAAAGSSQSDATEVEAGLSMVNSVGSGEGVKLPATPIIGSLFIIWNTDESNTLEVYPGTGDSINAAAANAGFTVAAMGCIILVATAAGQFYAVEPAVAAV